MNTYVYADIILLENLLMNYVILWSAGRFLRLKAKNASYIIASLIGSIYAILSYFPQFGYLSSFFMKLMLSLLMVIISYTPSSLRQFAKYTGVFYLVSFIFGGAAFGLYYFISGLSSTINGVSYISEFPVKLLLVSIATAYIIVKYCWDFIQYRIKRERVFTELSVLMDNKAASIRALVDTGNSLSDPLTKTPVIVAEFSSIQNLLPLEVQKIFLENAENNLNALSSIMSYSDIATRFRVIPFKSLGRENGMLIGFKPDEVHINDDKQVIKIKSIIIGIYNRKLSGNGEYSALIHPDIFANEQDISRVS